MRELAEDRRGLDWSDAEKRIFMDKFLQHPKDFAAIAAYLPHRCVSTFPRPRTQWNAFSPLWPRDHQTRTCAEGQGKKKERKSAWRFPAARRSWCTSKEGLISQAAALSQSLRALSRPTHVKQPL